MTGCRSAAEGVVRVRLPGWLSPETVALAQGGAADLAWIDAGYQASTGRSVLGWGDETVVASVGDAGGFAGALARLRSAGRPAGATRSATPAAPSTPAVPAAPGAPDAAATLGWYGWIGYGATDATLAAGDAGRGRRLADPHHPDLAFLRVRRALVFDHERGCVDLLRTTGDTPWQERMLRWWTGQGAAVRAPGTTGRAVAEREPPPAPRRGPARWADDDRHYLRLIARCQEAIRSGDAYQLCLTTSAGVEGVTDDLDTYRRLRRGSPAPRAAFVRIGGVAVLSASPELFLSITADGTVTTSPIKGTRPRGRTADEDRLLARELAGSDKEQAENVMIVDLMRNDLNRVCDATSVTVPEMLTVHSYAHVHQLVSTVRGRLRGGVSALDAVLACFPPGSMTGAPKHRAVDLLSRWESGPRGIYSGALGHFGLDGSATLAVVIRSIIVSGGSARVGAGGGITAQSVPTEELAEVKTKAAALLDALGAPAPRPPTAPCGPLLSVLTKG
ncbi:anthranilate synthase component I family protein [Streptomyces sp. NPDC055078]